jgi:hypothetical protein
VGVVAKESSEPFGIYSDESACGHFRSVGALSGPRAHLNRLRQELQVHLRACRTSSIEFKKISGDSRHEQAAIRFLCTGIEYTQARLLRIDVLTWNLRDARHTIFRRDDQKNLQLMYYKILKWVKQRWKGATLFWEFFPDQNSAIDWNDFIAYLEKTNLSKGVPYLKDLFGVLQNTAFPTITSHAECVSDREPLIQLADLFTGFAAFSCAKGSVYTSWSLSRTNQPDLFTTGVASSYPTSHGLASKYRCLGALLEHCKAGKMGVSFERRAHLWTLKPSNPLNFWFYEPQGEFDKAPTRPRR